MTANEPRRELPNSATPPRVGATRQDAVDAAEQLRLFILVRRKSGAPPLPDPLLGGPFLSRSEFAQTYGADQSDLELVADFARTAGLEVTESSPGRRCVIATGSAAQVSAAFKVELATYSSDEGSYRGYDGPVQMPASIADLVVGVFGLDNRPVARRGLTPDGNPPPPPPNLPVSMAITAIARYYGMPNLSGYGAKIGIVEFGGGWHQADLDAVLTQEGLDPPAPAQPVSVPPGASMNGLDGETTLDVEVAASAAPWALIAVYFASSKEGYFAYIDAVSAAVHDAVNEPTVLSISWGGIESAFTQSQIQAISSYFYDASQMGLTVFASSGDNGSNATVNNPVASVQYPATDPYVTAVGGTQIQEVEIITPIGIPVKELEEVPWTSGGPSGGGISYCFPVPPWQAGAGVPPSANNDGHTGRGIPDIAGDATGYKIVFGGKNTTSGGTSAPTPLYAALIATINPDQAILVQPPPLLGLLNPILYSPPFRSALKAVLSPNGKTNAPVSTPLGATVPAYPATRAWNAFTGWGSLNIPRFYDLINSPGVGAASARYGVVGQTDVYVVNFAGTLLAYSITDSTQGLGTWTGPELISVQKFAPPGAGVAVATPAGIDGRTLVFVVGSNGALNVFSSDSGGPWIGPNALSEPGFAPPGAYVAAGPRADASNETDVFVIGSDGVLHVFSLVGAGPWMGPTAIGPAFAQPGAPVAACAVGSAQPRSSVFAVGTSGALYEAWAQGGGNWNPPRPVGPGDEFPPLCGVSAVYLNDLVTVCAVGQNQRLTAYSVSTRPVVGGQAVGWASVAVDQDTAFPPGGATCLSPLFGSPGGLAAFAVGLTEFDVFTSDNGGSWAKAQQIYFSDEPNPNLAWVRPGAPVVTSQEFGVDFEPQLDVFVAANSSVWVSSWRYSTVAANFTVPVQVGSVGNYQPPWIA